MDDWSTSRRCSLTGGVRPTALTTASPTATATAKDPESGVNTSSRGTLVFSQINLHLNSNEYRRMV